MSQQKLKADFLGFTSFSNARNKLIKSILFDLIKKQGLDICYRCSSKIDQIDDLSIEHIKPWFKVDKELYWDLNNISFSHFICNTRAQRRERHEFCIRGHSLVPGNVYVYPNGGRSCRTCRKDLRKLDTRKSH